MVECAHAYTQRFIHSETMKRLDRLANMSEEELFLCHKVTTNVVSKKPNVRARYVHIIHGRRILKYVLVGSDTSAKFMSESFIEKHAISTELHCGKFVPHGRDISRAICMSSIYLRLNLTDLDCAILKVSSQG